MVRDVGRFWVGILGLALIGPTALGQVAGPTAPPRPTRVAATTPGYEVLRLPLPPSVLPSCMAVRPDGTLAIGSMDGEVMLVVDTDGDGVLDTYRKFAGNLPHWPLGLLADGDDLLIATRQALIRLTDADKDGTAERWATLTDAWDVTKDHHDWTTGVVPWPGGGWVVSPVTDDVRDKAVTGGHHLRGKAILVKPDGAVSVLGEGLRYPTGWAARRPDGAVFFTDNQGQQKTTCEVNRLVPGTWYGYPSRADPPEGPPGLSRYTPTIRIPYPWARSVNGLAFADTGGQFGPLEGQLILCEYNNRFLLRATIEESGGVEQGACYPFQEHLLGPLCLAFAPGGTLYVGSLREPSWAAEPEQGAIYRVRWAGPASFGVRSLTTESDGFTLRFLAPCPDRGAAADPARYAVRRYRHVFRGAYHSPPVDEQSLAVASALVAEDGLSVRLTLREPMVADRIYEVRTSLPGARPAIGHATVNAVPMRGPSE